MFAGKTYGRRVYAGKLVPAIAGTQPIPFLIPVSGRGNDSIILVGQGYGTTQGEKAGTIKLKDFGGTTLTCTITNWSEVAADPAKAFPYNQVHDEITFLVPSAAIPGVGSVWIETTV